MGVELPSKKASIRDSRRTRDNILKAALKEFADKGLAGARVDLVAEQAGINKRMLYYYFGGKDDLYRAVLEKVYSEMRDAEAALDLQGLTPMKAIERIVEFKFDYPLKHPYLIKLLAGENMLKAVNLKRLKSLQSENQKIIDRLEGLLLAGQADGSIRDGIDPLHLYVTISAVSYFYFSNTPSLSVTFGRDLKARSELADRRAHAIDVIARFLATG